MVQADGLHRRPAGGCGGDEATEARVAVLAGDWGHSTGPGPQLPND